eukprot:2073577-Pyramimonas_sp.AAC.1
MLGSAWTWRPGGRRRGPSERGRGALRSSPPWTVGRRLNCKCEPRAARADRARPRRGGRRAAESASETSMGELLR